jgi:hypothetical protein
LTKAIGTFAAIIAVAPAAETIDRVAVTVDRQAITESEVVEHIRAAALLNGTKPDLSAASKREAAERLVDLVLIRNEITVSGYQRPALEEAEGLLDQLRRERFKEPGSLERALAESGLAIADAKRILHEQLTLLRFIDFRFEAGILLSNGDVERHFEAKFLPRWKEQNKDQEPPALEDVRDQVEAELVDERGDLALEDWLKATRLQHRIVFRLEVFQ